MLHSIEILNIMETPVTDHNNTTSLVPNSPKSTTNAQLQEEYAKYCASLTPEDIAKLNQQIYDECRW